MSGAIIYQIDKNKISNNKCPVFCVNIFFLQLTDADSSVYYGLGYSVVDNHYFNSQEETTVRHRLTIRSFFSKEIIKTPEEIMTMEQYQNNRCF